MFNFTTLGWGIFIFGILLFVAVIATKNRNGIHKDVKWIAAIVAIVFILVPVFVGELQVQPAQISTGSSPDVSITSLTGATFISSSNTIKVVAEINASAVSWTSPTGGEVSFDAIITSLSTVDTFPSIVFAADPMITNTTVAASNSNLFSANTANSTMHVNVALPGNTAHNYIALSGVTYIVPLKAASTAQANFTMYLSAQALTNLNAASGVGSIVDYSLQIAGQTFTVEVVLTVA